MINPTIAFILSDGLTALIKRLPTLILIVIVTATVSAGPIVLLALGVGYLVQFPETIGTETADGEMALTWLGRFVVWHQDNQWFFPTVAIVLLYLAISWAYVAWIRKLAGFKWWRVPLVAWLGGIFVMAALIHGRAYLATLYPNNATPATFSIFFTFSYVGFRFAPAWVRASVRRGFGPRQAAAQVKPYWQAVLLASLFFALAEFGIQELEHYIDRSNFGTTNLELFLGRVVLPFLSFWFVSCVYSLAKITDQDNLSSLGPKTS